MNSLILRLDDVRDQLIILNWKELSEFIAYRSPVWGEFYSHSESEKISGMFMPSVRNGKLHIYEFEFLMNSGVGSISCIEDIQEMHKMTLYRTRKIMRVMLRKTPNEIKGFSELLIFPDIHPVPLKDSCMYCNYKPDLSHEEFGFEFGWSRLPTIMENSKPSSMRIMKTPYFLLTQYPYFWTLIDKT